MDHFTVLTQGWNTELKSFKIKLMQQHYCMIKYRDDIFIILFYFILFLINSNQYMEPGLSLSLQMLIWLQNWRKSANFSLVGSLRHLCKKSLLTWYSLKNLRRELFGENYSHEHNKSICLEYLFRGRKHILDM